MNRNVIALAAIASMSLPTPTTDSEALERAPRIRRAPIMAMRTADGVMSPAQLAEWSSRRNRRAKNRRRR